MDAEDSPWNAGLVSRSRRSPGEMRRQLGNSRGTRGSSGKLCQRSGQDLACCCGWVTWPAGPA